MFPPNQTPESPENALIKPVQALTGLRYRQENLVFGGNKDSMYSTRKARIRVDCRCYPSTRRWRMWFSKLSTVCGCISKSGSSSHPLSNAAYRHGTTSSISGAHHTYSNFVHRHECLVMHLGEAPAVPPERVRRFEAASRFYENCFS
jgi:hypothetical protein